MTETGRPIDTSLEGFLAWEHEQPFRYERVGGVVRMMPGGTLDHNRIAVNLAVALRAGLQGRPCSVFVNDVKVVAPTEDVMYPDVAVICPPPPDGRATYIREPTVVFEVLSASTAGMDYGQKRWAYASIATLQHYVLIDQTRPAVEIFSRGDDGAWPSQRIDDPSGSLALPALDIALPLAAIYENVTFEAG